MTYKLCLFVAFKRGLFVANQLLLRLCPGHPRVCRRVGQL